MSRTSFGSYVANITSQRTASFLQYGIARMGFGTTTHHAYIRCMKRYTYREDPNVPGFADDRAVMVFDGECGLCSAMVDFILRHDRADRIRLLPAQSDLGEALFAHYGMKSGDYETVLLLEGGYLRTKMDASLRLFSLLGWPWRLAGVGRLMPKCLANPIYELIARNRIRWFGRRETCRVATAADREHFL